MPRKYIESTLKAKCEKFNITQGSSHVFFLAADGSINQFFKLTISNFSGHNFSDFISEPKNT